MASTNLYRVADVASATLSYAGLIQFSTVQICAAITYGIFIDPAETADVETAQATADSVKSNIVTVGENCDYATLQAAIDGCGDSISNPVTILIYPGTYARFDTFETYGDARTRYISLIGVNRETCIVRDDSGEYLTPPANGRFVGLIKGLTIIATHDSPPATPENAKRKAYAIHLDSGKCVLLVDDCKLVSYQAPAAGIGLYQDSVVKFRNCDFYSHAPVFDDSNDPNDYQTNYSYLSNYGALFCHSNTADNVTNQNLILDNCRFYSTNSDKAVWVSKSGNFVNCEMNLTVINCMAISEAAGSVKFSVGAGITLTPDSYGNNDAGVND